MTQYEFDRGIHKSFPTMSDKDIDALKPEFIKFLKKYNGNYYLLLNHNIRSYTVFTYICELPDLNKMVQEILDTIKSFGELKEVVIDVNNMIEFWVVDRRDNECYMYALFNYDEGVIEV